MARKAAIELCWQANRVFRLYGAESWSGTIGVELADATAQTDHYIADFGFRIEEMRHIALVSF